MRQSSRIEFSAKSGVLQWKRQVLDHLPQVFGRLKMELDWLKKDPRHLEGLRQ
jgi:hypothetical protein